MNKRITSLLLGLGMCIVSVAPTFASEPISVTTLSNGKILTQNQQNKLSSEDAKNILNKYDFTTETIDIKDIPKDATVLKFNTKEEMEKYFTNAEKDFKIQNERNMPYEDQVISKQTDQLPNGETRLVETIRRSTNKKYGGTNCNLIADIQVYSSGSFRQINRASQRTNISGSTIGMGWRQTSIGNNLNGKPSMSVRAYGSGQLITYVIVGGNKVEVGRRNVDLSLTYSV